MKRFVMLCAIAIVGVPLPVWAAAGDVDAVVRTLIGGNLEFTSMLQQADGKIVVATTAAPVSNDDDFVLTRYNADLSTDRTFGIGGVTVAAISPYDDWVRSLVQQSTGRLVVAGHWYRPSVNGQVRESFVLARYNTNGSLDPTFGTDGVVTTTLDEISELYGLVRQPDDKLIAVGCTGSYPPAGGGFCGQFAVLVRYNADGSLDTTFGENGTVKLVFGPPNHLPNRMSGLITAVVEPDGSILAAGTAAQLDDSTIVLVRVNADGVLDPTFGTGGMVTTSTKGHPGALIRQPDGKLLVGGSRGFEGGLLPYGRDTLFVLARYNPNGTLDTTFGDNGVVTAAIDIMDYDARLALLPDGRIVLAGTTEGHSSFGFGLIRYNADGTPDGRFGTGGRVRTTVTGPSALGDIALMPSGELLAAGHDQSRITLVRYQGDVLPTRTPTATPTPLGASGNANGGSSGCAITPGPQGGLLPVLFLTVVVLLRRRRKHRPLRVSAGLVVLLPLAFLLVRPNLARAIPTFTQVTKGLLCPGGTSALVSTPLDANTMSADGRRVVFETHCNPIFGPGGVFLFDSVTGVTTQITTSDCGARTPVISADGRRVAFASICDHTGDNPNRVWQVVLFDAATSRFTQVTPRTSCDGSGPIFSIGLSADGTRVVFETGCDFTTGHPSRSEAVYLFDATRHTLTQLTPNDDCGSVDPVINPDGTRIIFRSNCDFGRGPYGGGQIFVAALESSGAPCAGDCNLSGTVTVDELIAAVNIALGTAALSRCDAADANYDGRITVDEILSAVNSALEGSPTQ